MKLPNLPMIWVRAAERGLRRFIHTSMAMPWRYVYVIVAEFVHRPVFTAALNWTINFDERSLSSPMRSLSMSHLNTKSCSLLCLPCAQEEGRGRRLNIYSGSVKKVLCTFLRCTKRIAKSNEEQSSSKHYTWGDIETSNKEKLRIIFRKAKWGGFA